MAESSNKKPRRSPRITVSSTQKAVRIPRKRIAELVQFVARSEGAAVADLDIAVVGAKEMALHNKRFLSHSGPTDVISFDLSEAGRGGLSVQLILCGDVAAAEAAARGLGKQHELMLYVVHGLLHMMGYEDQSIRGAAKMHAREEDLLGKFLAGKPKLG